MPHDMINQELRVGDSISVSKYRGTILSIDKDNCFCIYERDGKTYIAGTQSVLKVA